MTFRGVLGVAALAAMAWAGPASAGPGGKQLFGGGVAAADPGTEYFLGHWAMGAIEDCADSDTMSFLASGAWAATNGRGNPVEGVGTWTVAGGALTLTYTEFRDPESVETFTLTLTEAEDSQFVADLEGIGETVYRCPN